jgi:hypothetical protein
MHGYRKIELRMLTRQQGTLVLSEDRDRKCSDRAEDFRFTTEADIPTAALALKLATVRRHATPITRGAFNCTWDP